MNPGTMSETFEQFAERMSRVEKTDEFFVGPRHAGNTRALFEFEGQHCQLETFNMPFYGYPDRTPPLVRCIQAIHNPPSFYWIHSRLFYGKARAKTLAKHYGATFNEDEYPREAGAWFYLVFKEFEDLMRLAWDIHTGRFKERFGDEAKEYQSCIGYLEEAG